MLDLALGAAVVMGLVLPDLLTRHQRALRKSVFELQASRPENAERLLDSIWVRHALPWEHHRRSLCRLLRAHVKGLAGDAAAGLAQCEELLSDTELPTALRGLAYLRLAAFHPAPKSEELASGGEDLWAEGVNDLASLNLWEDLCYLLWALKDSARAAYCIDRALETHWNSQNLYMRYVCYSESGVSRDEQLKMAEIALEYNKLPPQKAALLHVISSLHLLAGRYTQAQQAFERYKSLRIYAHPHFVDRYSILIHRASGDYEKAEAARARLFDKLGPDGYIPMLGILHDDGEYEHGVELLQTRKDSQDPATRYALGTFSLELGDPVAAIDYFEPDHHVGFSPSTQYNLVRCYAMLCRQDMVEHHLQQLPASEKDLERTFRVHLAYLWDGDPALADQLRVSEEFCLEKAYYEGDYQRYLEDGCAHMERICAVLPWEFKSARLAFHKASAHELGENWSEAVAEFEEAEKHFLQSPYDRARCRIHQLECRAHLGEKVDAELASLLAHLHERFPHSTFLQREGDSACSQVALSQKRYQQVVEIVTSRLGLEERAFFRAWELKKRALAHLALGRTAAAHEDFRAVVEACPGSFLAVWAEEQLKQA